MQITCDARCGEHALQYLMEFSHPQPKFCSNTLKMLNINCEKKLNESCQQESSRLGVFPSGESTNTRFLRSTLACWQLDN